jgi:alkanesulfonate monooxygenase SsuD/methylene tetrahydromethanopterin reductase-like flavin-dependent oxidoreductase (luciferase family)
VTITIGYQPPPEWTVAPAGDRRALLHHTADVGVDHIGLSDHVSFHRGTGFDGIVHAAAVLATEPRLRVLIGAMLVPLRHPLVLARQIADVDAIAPGQLHVALGVGGDDRRELQNCGIDPSTRGARADESVDLLRRLLAGEVVDHRGPFYELDGASIRPSPFLPVPLFVAGRSGRAVHRAGTLGDGWLGIWVSPRRYAEAMAEARALAMGRPLAGAMCVWCGIDADPAKAQDQLAYAMQDLYALPYDRFARYCPVGPPEVIAEFLAPYVEAGCRTFTLLARGADPFRVAEGVGEVRRLLGADVVIDLETDPAIPTG